MAARIQTQLCNDTEELRAAFGPSVAGGADAVALFALGIQPQMLTAFARTVPAQTPVLLADCYGILGFSPGDGKNLELMEAGRGQEYGGVGGDGGRGVVAVVFSGEFEPSTSSLPTLATSHLAITTSASSATALLVEHGTAPYYGGVAKAAYRYAPASGEFEHVAQFFISSTPTPAAAVGTTCFTDDAQGAVKELLEQVPEGHRVEAVALMPCFMRGKNLYGRNDVEPDALAKLLPGVAIFGMFCHGELGPKRCLGFDSTGNPEQSCRTHSMTSIVAVHTSRSNA
jgi:hypothetical protein